MSIDAGRFTELKNRLNEAGIPTEKAGFFDHPAFVAIEKEDPNFLDEYARFVHWNQFDAAYIERAERIINIVSDELHRGLVIEGRLGACIDTSMTMGRILDLYGVWNYVVRGSLRIEFPATSGHDQFCFWPVDEDDGSGREYGHKWLVAPPFSVIDLTLKLQDYPRPFANLLPAKVLAKNPITTHGEPEDILCPGAIRYARQNGLSPAQALAQFVPKFVDAFSEDFPAYVIPDRGGLKLKYVPVGIGGSDAPLKRIRSFMVKGRTAFEFYEQEIKPKLAAEGFEETLSETEFPGTPSATITAQKSALNRRPIMLSQPKSPNPTASDRAEARKKHRKKGKRKRR